MIFTRIYLEGNEFFINKILELARGALGDGCNVIDLVPELKEEEKEN